MASFYEFLRDTGDAIQRNVGDPYAKALTRAARTGNYNPFDIIANAEINRRAAKIVEENRSKEKAAQQKVDETPSKEQTKENPDDYVEFTYVPGDTFGQKILDLGIGTDNGLWGENGDVAFYTQQLIDGGYLDDNGNVKLGVPIRLKKRK